MAQHDFSPDEDADEYDEASEEGGGASEVSDAQPGVQVSAAELESRGFADSRTCDMGAQEHDRFINARERDGIVPKYARWVELTTGETCKGSKARIEVRMRLPPSCASI